MVQAEQFGEGATENLNAHLESFLNICDTFKQDRVSSRTIKMRMFWFSLQDRVKNWFKSLD